MRVDRVIVDHLIACDHDGCKKWQFEDDEKQEKAHRKHADNEYIYQCSSCDKWHCYDHMLCVSYMEKGRMYCHQCWRLEIPEFLENPETGGKRVEP